MPLDDVIGRDSIVPALRVSSKKQALQAVAERAAVLTGIDERDIFETLNNREKLGSTGVGNGVAIPHGKHVGLDRIVGVFARLAAPIDFEALDDQPVDLMFLLLAPEDAGAEHLKTLARVARILREPDRLARLRETDTTRDLLGILTEKVKSDAA